MDGQRHKLHPLLVCVTTATLCCFCVNVVAIRAPPTAVSTPSKQGQEQRQKKRTKQASKRKENKRKHRTNQRALRRRQHNAVKQFDYHYMLKGSCMLAYNIQTLNTHFFRGYAYYDSSHIIIVIQIIFEKKHVYFFIYSQMI